jgi:hypothetical protein
MSDERKSIPLFLCCAEDNEVTLVRVVEALQKEGFNPEVVAGVDGDGSLLGSAVDNAEPRALFVICRSKALDRSHVRRLEGLFSARRGPQQRVLTVTLIDDKPLEIMPAIREAMKSLLSAPPESMRPSTELNRDLMRDVVGPGKREERVEADREELARKLHEEMVAAEALLTRRGSSAPAKVSTPPPSADDLFSDLPDEPRPLSDGIPSAPLPAEGTVQLGGPVEPEDETMPLPETSSSSTSKSAVPEVSEQPGESSEELPSPEDEPKLKKKAWKPAAEASAEDEELVAESLDEDTNEQDVGSSTTGRHRAAAGSEGEERPVSRGMIYAGVVGLAAAVVMAISFMGAEPDTSDAEIEAAVDRAKAKAHARKGAPDPGQNVASASAGSASVPPTEAPTTPESNQPDTSPQADASKPSGTPATDASPPEPAPPKDPPKSHNDSPPPPPADDTPSSVDDPSKRIRAALAAGHLEDLGSKVVAMNKESQTWSQANRACRRQSVDGIGGFRLPNNRELQKMKGSGILDAGAYYWSRDKGESDDEAYALDTRTGDTNVYLKMESIARAACIRRK